VARGRKRSREEQEGDAKGSKGCGLKGEEGEGKARLTGSHDDELADTSVEGLGSLVSSLLELLEVRGLLHKIKNL